MLSRYGIGIDAVLQRPGYPHNALPFIITLETARSAQLDALSRLDRLMALPDGGAPSAHAARAVVETIETRAVPPPVFGTARGDA